MKRLTLFCLLLSKLAAGQTPEEQKLYNLIMEYRKANSLPAIPLSPALTKVAQIHVRDLEANPPKGNCNLHSWSDKGNWVPVCYTDDHAQAKGMWSKPSELTDYKGKGFEIAFVSGPKAPVSLALSGWKSSPGHNAVILNEGVWSQPWKAIGVGLFGGYAVVWFGREQ